jgi:hypothetical protein
VRLLERGPDPVLDAAAEARFGEVIAGMRRA